MNLSDYGVLADLLLLAILSGFIGYCAGRIHGYNLKCSEEIEREMLKRSAERESHE